MKKHYLFLFFPFLFYACGKNGNSDDQKIYKGIVLHPETHAPIAGANVELNFVLYWTDTNAAVEAFGIVKTNAQGEFTAPAPVSSEGQENYYYILVTKPGYAQVEVDKKFLKGDGQLDTVYLDNASYVRIKTKVSSTVNSPRLSYSFLRPADPSAIVSRRWLGRDHIYDHAGDPAAVLLDSFPFTEYSRVYLQLSKLDNNNSFQPVVQKEVNLRKLDTTDVEIEY